jgi:hypothetical protein
MRRMAEALGKSDEAAAYAAQAAVVKQAFNARFFTVSEVPVEPVPKDTSIVILKALYGVPSQQADVKDKLRSLVADGKYQFAITNSLAGKDPAPSKVKSLELEYTINGVLKNQTLKEHEICFLNTRAVDTYGSQTGTALALHSGLVPDGQEQRVADGLAALIMEKSGGRYTTGIFGHRPLYTVLDDYGHADVTRHLWQVTGWPSLRFLTEEHGLTTWPEVPMDWPKGERYRRNSFNHPMHSGFAATFHESLGGIRPDPDQPGFKHFILKPCFLPGLEWVRAEHRSPYGLISSDWKKEGDNIDWNVVIPTGSSAAVRLSQYSSEKMRLNGQPVEHPEFELTSGKWRIEIGK